MGRYRAIGYDPSIPYIICSLSASRMIIYDLQCANDHRFEGWFKNAPEFEKQLTGSMIHCPVCGTEQVAKIPTASHLSLSKTMGSGLSAAQTEQAILSQDAEALLYKLHEHVKQNYEDVGDEFATEAKRIHYGEVEERNIRGNATKDEISELNDEGIMALPLPDLPDKDKLN